MRCLVHRTAIGIKCKDGVVLAVEKLVHSKLLVPGVNKRILTVDRHVGLVRSKPLSNSYALKAQYYQTTAGLLADGRHVSNRAREEASNYRETYKSPSPLKVA